VYSDGGVALESALLCAVEANAGIVGALPDGSRHDGVISFNHECLFGVSHLINWIVNEQAAMVDLSASVSG
jgi:hypothetical protein